MLFDVPIAQWECTYLPSCGKQTKQARDNTSIPFFLVPLATIRPRPEPHGMPIHNSLFGIWHTALSKYAMVNLTIEID